jgi:mannose-6-phosphate isomerase-like protein (cupin superfamily)
VSAPAGLCLDGSAETGVGSGGEAAAIGRRSGNGHRCSPASICALQAAPTGECTARGRVENHQETGTLYIKRTVDCAAFLANDGCHIRELLHPEREPLPSPYSLAHAEVAGHARTVRHRLNAVEVYYILDGCGVMHVDEEHAACMPGDIIRIPSGAVQWIENPGSQPLRFLCIVDPPWRLEDDIRLPDSPG